MLKMRLEQGQPALQQALQLGVLSIGNWHVLQRGVYCLVIGDLFVNIGLVEGGAAQAGELRAFALGLACQALAGGVVLGRDIELLDQRERLVVHGSMVADHLLREGAHGFILGLVEGLFARIDVDQSGGVGHMSDLGVGRVSAATAAVPSASAAKVAMAILCMTVPFLWADARA